MLTSVTSPAAGRLGQRQGVVGRGSRVPPAASGTNSSNTERSKQTEVAASTPASSAGAKRAERPAHQGGSAPVARSPPPWAGRSSPRCRSRRPGCPGRSRAPAVRAHRRDRRAEGASSGQLLDLAAVPREQPPQAGARQHQAPAPLSASMKAQPLGRVGGIERHVGAAGLEHGEEGDHQLGARGRTAPRPAPRAPRPAPRSRAASAGAGPPARRRSAARSPADQRRRRPGVRAACSSEAGRAAGRPRGSAQAGVVPLDQHLVALAPPPAAAGRRPARRDRRAPPPAAARAARPGAATVAPSKRSASYCRRPISPPCHSASARVTSNCAPGSARATDSSSSAPNGTDAPAAPAHSAAMPSSPDRRPFWSTAATWKSGGRDGSRSGCSRSASSGSGKSWWSKAPRAASRTRSTSSPKEGSPRRSTSTATGLTR